MLFKKLILLSVLIAYSLLSACGFQPLYAKRSNNNGEITTTNKLLASVKIESIKNRQGQILHNMLLDRFSFQQYNIAKKYKLSTTIKISTKGLGVKSDDSTSRNKLTVVAKFKLVGAKKIREFSISQVSGYSKTEAEYPTMVAEQDAIKRNLREIANDAKIRVAIYLEQDRNNK